MHHSELSRQPREPVRSAVRRGLPPADAEELVGQGLAVAHGPGDDAQADHCLQDLRALHAVGALARRACGHAALGGAAPGSREQMWTCPQATARTSSAGPQESAPWRSLGLQWTSRRAYLHSHSACQERHDQQADRHKGRRPGQQAHGELPASPGHLRQHNACRVRREESARTCRNQGKARLPALLEAPQVQHAPPFRLIIALRL